MQSAGRPPRNRNKLFACLPRPPLIGFLSFIRASCLAFRPRSLRRLSGYFDFYVYDAIIRKRKKTMS